MSEIALKIARTEYLTHHPGLAEVENAIGNAMADARDTAIETGQRVIWSTLNVSFDTSNDTRGPLLVLTVKSEAE